MRHLHYRTLALLIAGLLVAPAAALAQACVGSPAGSGGTSLGLSVGLPQGAKAYGGAVRYNTLGPVSVGLGYTLTKVDEVDANMHAVAGDAAFELPLAGVSVCPLAGASYSRFSLGDLTASVITVPVGLGLGYRLQAGPSMALIPHAVPQFFWMRASSNLTDETETDTQFGALVGLTLQMRQFFLSGGVTKTTAEGSEAVLSLGLGFVL